VSPPIAAEDHSGPTHWDTLLAAAIGLLSLALYVRTLAPGLLPGDSGEFQTLAILLGHTHPTGYPVYLVLARLLSLLPIGDTAWRVNLFSAVMAAWTVAGVYAAGRLLTRRRAVAASSALALAVSPTFWSQAIIAEVYTPGAAFLIWILVALLRWDATGRPHALFVAGLLGGLSLGVHMSVALLLPAVLVFVAATLVARQAPVSIPRSLASALGGAVAGLAVLLLVFLLIDWNNPTASYFQSVVEPSRSAWGLSAEQIDGPFDQLLFGWSARQFRSFMFANPIAVMPNLAGRYWGNLPSELAWPMIVLADIGALGLLVRRPRAAALLLVALLTQWLCTFNYDIWDLYVFFIPSYVLLAVLAAAGLGVVVDIVGRLVSRWGNGRALADVVLAALVLIVAVWPVFQPRLDAVRQGKVAFTSDDSDEYPASAHSSSEDLQALLRPSLIDAPENAIIFLDWDRLYPSYYVAHIELGRSDLMFVETYAADDQRGLASSVLEFIATHQAEHPVFVSDRLPELLAAGYSLAPLRVGPTRLYRVVRRDE
jgi:4-amino-4-deoxy-L-arabinose transferase-like glycosyltransferase